MAKALFVLLTSIVSLNLASNIPVVQFFFGFSSGYGLGDTCKNELLGIDGKWVEYIETDRDGTGAALSKLRDFTGYVALTATDCSLLEVANLMDNAFTTNRLATILRLIASFETIREMWGLFWTGLLNFDYPVAGEAFGIVVKKLVG